MKKSLIAAAMFGVFFLIAFLIVKFPPKSQQKLPDVKPVAVEVIRLKKQDIQVKIDSFGTVKPRTQTTIYPQVSGQIVNISGAFRPGRFFKKGDVLVSLDRRDLEAEVNIAKADVLSAKQQLAEEEARVKQAKLDWSRLGNTEQAPDLVLRKPQLEAALAKLLSQEARLNKAQLGLERTSIKAPFDGRVLKQLVDVGQLVSNSTALAEIYATDYVEVRLPIKNKDLPFIALPDGGRMAKVDKVKLPKVTFYSDLNLHQTWQGRVIRTESAFDELSQQLFVVAQIDDPYGLQHAGGISLKIGQYVTAVIDGRRLRQVISIPNRAIYQNSYVYVFNDGVLLKKPITITWQNDKVSVIESGLSEGDKLVITTLGQILSGTKAKVIESKERLGQ
ncbi:MAG: efflux RND transporter periplasmic adaptor subunit [Cellvibrionales bacterium]|nr:efflux RND transporter periplasmic adaptor subunit [Cellvibrionales bacterium]